PLVKKVDQGGGQAGSPGGWATFLPTQQTGPGQTARQHHPPRPPARPEPTRDTLAPMSIAPQVSGSAGDDDVLVLLVSKGVTHRIAQAWVKTPPPEAIRHQVAWQPYRPVATSPAGALVQAIRDAWPPPPAWVEAQEHAVAVTRHAQEEARRRVD